jgi:hypothetical protein
VPLWSATVVSFSGCHLGLGFSSSGCRSVSEAFAPLWHATGTTSFIYTKPIDHRNSVKLVLTPSLGTDLPSVGAFALNCRSFSQMHCTLLLD